MNLRRIAENFRFFPRMQLEDWSLAEILTAIFNDVVSLEFRSDTAELLDRERIALYSMFDFPHGPSTVCELHVLTVDDELVGLALCQGKGDWVGHALNQAGMQRVALDLAAAAARNDVTKLPKVNLDKTLPLSGYPLHFLDADETMFVLRDPRSIYRLNEVPERHRTYFVDNVGQVHSVTSIGAFKLKGWRDGKPPADDLVSIVVGGEVHMVDATQLLFELVANRGNLEAALEVYRRPNSWQVKKVASLVNRVILHVTVPHRWDSETVWAEFISAPSMERFLQQYPVGVAVAGTFDATLLGPYGKIHVVK